MEFVGSNALDDGAELPVVKDDPLTNSCSLEGGWKLHPSGGDPGCPWRQGVAGSR